MTGCLPSSPLEQIGDRLPPLLSLSPRNSKPKPTPPPAARRARASPSVSEACIGPTLDPARAGPARLGRAGRPCRADARGRENHVPAPAPPPAPAPAPSAPWGSRSGGGRGAVGRSGEGSGGAEEGGGRLVGGWIRRGPTSPGRPRRAGPVGPTRRPAPARPLCDPLAPPLGAGRVLCLWEVGVCGAAGEAASAAAAAAPPPPIQRNSMPPPPPLPPLPPLPVCLGEGSAAAAAAAAAAAELRRSRWGRRAGW